MIRQDVEVSWIAGITFFKEGQWCEKMVKTSILETKLRISEILLQQQIHGTSKETLNNDY